MSQHDPFAATCRGVVKIYWTASGEVHALKGVDAVVAAGAVTALVGPSGSGKSSLLRILAGLDRPTAGGVSVGGHELVGLSRRRLRQVRRRLVGYVFQRPSQNLLGHLRAREHLTHAAALRGVRDIEPAELLHRLGIGARAEHTPAQLSGGEQQRLALAQALVGDPPLLIADEPTAELDHHTGLALLDEVHALAQRGTGVLIATHDPQVVATADRVLHLRHGALEAETDAGEIFSVIDEAGRIQLPPEALRVIGSRRAVLHIDADQVRITPPGGP